MHFKKQIIYNFYFSDYTIKDNNVATDKEFNPT